MLQGWLGKSIKCDFVKFRVSHKLVYLADKIHSGMTYQFVTSE